MTEMKEIGGYFGLETFTGREYHENVLRLNLGRTALLYLLEKLGCRKLYLPYYLCDSVTERCRESGRGLEFYYLDRNLVPLLDHEPEKDAWVYLVNHYGQLTDDKILLYKKKYVRIIVDHTHAFFQKALPGIPTIYSIRKFFGLPDGAYLSADIETDEDLMADRSAGRMGHILGRFEDGASVHYQTMLKNAGTFHKEPVRKMSALTENLLKGIDYEEAKKRRENNYAYLKSCFGDANPLPFTDPDGPFVYPFYVKNAQAIRKEMAAQAVFIPVYWGNVISSMPVDSVEYDYAANILPLPCDQRYVPEDLVRMTELFRNKGVI